MPGRWCALVESQEGLKLTTIFFVVGSATAVSRISRRVETSSSLSAVTSCPRCGVVESQEGLKLCELARVGLLVEVHSRISRRVETPSTQKPTASAHKPQVKSQEGLKLEKITASVQGLELGNPHLSIFQPIAPLDAAPQRLYALDKHFKAAADNHNTSGPSSRFYGTCRGGFA